nr:MAG TPA: hypothetical protein [Caudoviricetes sp.]
MGGRRRWRRESWTAPQRTPNSLRVRENGGIETRPEASLG